MSPCSVHQRIRVKDALKRGAYNTFSPGPRKQPDTRSNFTSPHALSGPQSFWSLIKLSHAGLLIIPLREELAVRCHSGPGMMSVKPSLPAATRNESKLKLQVRAPGTKRQCDFHNNKKRKKKKKAIRSPFYSPLTMMNARTASSSRAAPRAPCSLNQSAIHWSCSAICMLQRWTTEKGSCVKPRTGHSATSGGAFQNKILRLDNLKTDEAIDLFSLQWPLSHYSPNKQAQT